MSRMPVTLADQGIFIEPEDADELTDLLADAAWVIGSLAGGPAAEDACAGAPGQPGSCAELAIDLRLAAAGLDEARHRRPGKPLHGGTRQERSRPGRESHATRRGKPTLRKRKGIR